MEFEVFKDFQKRNGEPLSKEQFLNNLSESVSPRLGNIGPTIYDGEHLWFSDFNQEGIKLVVKYLKLKGYSGVLSWGACFNFVPTITNKKTLKNHNTEKNTTLHLWEWPDGYKKSFEGGGRPTELISHYSGDCKNSLETFMDSYHSRITNWFFRANSIAGSLEIVKEQIEKKGAYNIHNPHPKFVHPFLLAKAGKLEEGIEILNDLASKYIEHDSSYKAVFDELENRLKSC